MAAEICHTGDQKAQPGKGRQREKRRDGGSGNTQAGWKGWDGSDEAQVWLLSLWRATVGSSVGVKCVQLLSVPGASLALGKGSWDVSTLSLRPRLPHA